MSEPQEPQSKSRRRWRWLIWTSGVLAALAVIVVMTAAVLWHQAQPFFRQRAIAALETDFHAHVELDRLDVTPGKVHQVTGGGLRITPIGLENYPPAIIVRSFSFRMNFWDIFNPRRHVRFAQVDGLIVTLPPAPARRPIHPDGVTGNHSKLIVDAFVCNDAQLNILHDDPKKPALSFNIQKLKVETPLIGGPLHYEATLVNPTPRGDIHSVGTFGPWNDDDPRSTPVTGDFTFTNADLSTIKGIAGILSSRGHFGGPLDHLTVDGSTETPDFRLAESEHPVALYTTYHAIVDGTTGDTYLQPVQAHFRNTYFTCTGKVIKLRGQGHDIQLNVVMPRGRVEDSLWLAVKSDQPLLTGALAMHAALDIPPDPYRTVEKRLRLNGAFQLNRVSFTNDETDRRIDEVSLRAQGKPDEAKALSGQKGRDDLALTSSMAGNFSLADGVLSLHPATFQMPGLQATMTGTYALSGQTMNINGTARLDVAVSRLVGGWKSLLLKPLDPLFRKQGAPAVIPFAVSGPRDAPEFSVKMGSFSVGMKARQKKKASSQDNED